MTNIGIIPIANANPMYIIVVEYENDFNNPNKILKTIIAIGSV